LFLGKVILEKILRSIPEVGTIYLLIRSKVNYQKSFVYNFVNRRAPLLLKDSEEKLQAVLVLTGSGKHAKNLTNFLNLKLSRSLESL
jgi:hypothetical protein